MRNDSKTDWKRLSKMKDKDKDKDIDISDILELEDDFFKQADIKVPPKYPITLRLDADVLSWFKS